ncbi:MAG: TVP38/TMEM64 family protein [Chthoniobacterales bacterium]
MSWLAKYWKWIALAIVLVALSTATAFLPVKDWVTAFSDWVRTLGAVGVVVFIGVYALATVLFLPGWIFTVAAGLVYGVLGGTAVALAGAIIGSTLAFLCGRYLVRSRVEAATKGNKKFAAIDKAIGDQGWKIVGLLRLSPLIPFNLSNYFYGVTRVGFVPYVLASAVGMLPGTLLYAYLGGAGKAGLGGGGGQSPLKYVFLGVGLIATIIVTIIVSRTAKKALAKTGAAEAERKEK